MVMLAYYYHDLPKVDEIENNQLKQKIYINYSDGSNITTLGDLYGNQVVYSEIPRHLINAIIATEDRRFFDHNGIDIFGIIRAFYINYKERRIVQGGSTITQQLVKLAFLTPKKTIKRKVQEILLALKIENILSKEQIISLYLNKAYFGSGNYGIVSAADQYFNKSVEDLNLNESAMLAGLLKAPSKLNPKNNKRLAENRASQVIKNMINAGYLGINDVSHIDKLVHYKIDRSQKFYFVDYISKSFKDYISASYNEKDLVIHTTLDKEIQTIVEEEVSNLIVNYKSKLLNSQLSVIVMAKDGAVLSMIGGRDYKKSQFNRAIYSKRQSGSVFKTIIYLTALQNGYMPDDIMEDKEITIGNWSPKNYDQKYYGNISLKRAFSVSSNSVSAQLVSFMDNDIIVNNARKMGILSKIDKDDSTIALGTVELTLFELVTAYNVIANDAFAVIPYSIVSISDINEFLYERNSAGFFKVFNSENNEMLKSLLRDVIKNGTGINANVSNDIYGKTGTSQDYRDAWFIGFNEKYTIGVWIGNDDNSPTNKITGGSLPALLFANIMERIS